MHRPATFKLAPASFLRIAMGDLTLWRADNGAIVNAANSAMLGGGGVDGAIHRRAGPKLLRLCEQVPELEPGVRCPVGEARLTSGETKLGVRHVIHTVGPVYHVESDPALKLESCYRSSLALANDNGIEHVAFPAISCGAFGYPLHEAAEVAMMACKQHVGEVKEVVFVLFGEDTLETWLSAAESLLEPDDAGIKSAPNEE
uniref:Appr-1-p processing enzyme family protein n=1 Tax=Tetraselmis sp. GSL018 TaxID=582737 RepID=A0A061RXJ6_9CHLO|mmetsp:Transcript_11896/g.28244  ORF Transcript_11896/g.28244 Transcript_11896/m.28244 type:complete len:201 (-) Transcript_11896:392-994(-)